MPLGRRFVTVWTGQTLSQIGSVVSAIGVAVFVFVETGSAAWLGLLSAFAALPYALTGPFIAWVDRFPRRTMMIAADTAASIGPIFALILSVLGHLEIWHLVVAAFFSGVGSSFQLPASQAAIPLLVDRSNLDRANGYGQMAPAMGMILGPVLATPLVAWRGIEAVLIVDLISFVVAVITCAVVRFDQAFSEAEERERRGWRPAFRWLRGPGRAFLVLLVMMAITNFALSFFNVALLAVATNVGGTERAGLAMGAVGASMVVGSFVVGRRGVSGDRAWAMVVALCVFGIGCLIAASRPVFLLVVVGAALAVAAFPAGSAAMATAFHEHVPPHLHGRIFGLRSALGRSLDPLGLVLAGVVIASAADPAMADGGSLAPTVGAVIGVGAERGAALVLGLAGIGLLGIAMWLRSSWIRPVLTASPDAAAEPG